MSFKLLSWATVSLIGKLIASTPFWCVDCPIFIIDYPLFSKISFFILGPGLDSEFPFQQSPSLLFISLPPFSLLSSPLFSFLLYLIFPFPLTLYPPLSSPILSSPLIFLINIWLFSFLVFSKSLHKSIILMLSQVGLSGTRHRNGICRIFIRDWHLWIRGEESRIGQSKKSNCSMDHKNP